MRRISVIALCLLTLAVGCITAQNDRGTLDDFGRIDLTVYLPTESNIPPQAQRILQSKMNQIAVKNGISSVVGSPFVFTATVDVIDSQVTSTVPVMYVFNFNFNFYVGDGLQGTLFSTCSMQRKGTGQTEAKAYISALKNINVNAPEFKMLLDKGKNRIIEYYNTQCEFLLKDAQAKADRREYEEAIAELQMVPTICKDCYDLCAEKTIHIYLEMLDVDCLQKLSLAQSIWSAKQDTTAAREACEIIAIIDPASPSFDKAEALRAEIDRFVKDVNGTGYLLEILERLDAMEPQKDQDILLEDARKATENKAEPIDEYNTDWQ